MFLATAATESQNISFCPPEGGVRKYNARSAFDDTARYRDTCVASLTVEPPAYDRERERIRRK